MLHNLDFLGEQFPELLQCKEFSTLTYEAQRSNYQFIHLLTLFKLEQKDYLLQVDDTNIYELLEDTVDACFNNFKQEDISIEIDCPCDLNWSMDQYLVSSLISNVLNNAYRYTKSKILLIAKIVDDRLCLQIHDDGHGYPQNMLEGATANNDSQSSNTGLGLVFAQIIAQLHKRIDKQGEIQLNNGGKLPGSCFTLYLP